MDTFISVIIPNYNGGATLGKCLEAALASDYGAFEVIVVDDCSTDNSVDIISEFPCRLVRLEKRVGAAGARNAGALQSRGALLFFTDSDCLLEPDSLSLAARAARAKGPRCVIGGTYTLLPYDDDFFSIFQSVFIHYSETKRIYDPDYIASHALIVDAQLFRESGGFPEDFMPILEDVEFSHRLRGAGVSLTMEPALQVRHIFRYSFLKSLRNAYRKTKYWVRYSLANKDLFVDSGTASLGLKVNGIAWLANTLLAAAGFFFGSLLPTALIPVIFGVALYVNWGLFALCRETKGFSFALLAALYYTFVYPAAIWAGTAAGVIGTISGRVRCKLNEKHPPGVL